jgi:hypothetical protein
MTNIVIWRRADVKSGDGELSPFEEMARYPQIGNAKRTAAYRKGSDFTRSDGRLKIGRNISMKVAIVRSSRKLLATERPWPNNG